MPLILFGLAAWSCTTTRESAPGNATLKENADDTTTYEVVIIDNQFEQWYLMNFTPSEDRSDEYYRGKNIIAVANWNQYFNTGKYKRVIESYIDYWPAKDYGIEVNRKLYWYFKYIEETTGVPLFK